MLKAADDEQPHNHAHQQRDIQKNQIFIVDDHAMFRDGCDN